MDETATPSPRTDVVLADDDLAHALDAPAKRELLWKKTIRLLELGHRTVDIAHALDKTPTTLYRWFSDPRFILMARQHDDSICERIDEELGDLKARINATAPHAFDALREILATTGDERLKVSVAESLMDRAGYQPIKKVVKANIDVQMTPEGARALLDGFKESVTVEKKPPVGRSVEKPETNDEP